MRKIKANYTKSILAVGLAAVMLTACGGSGSKDMVASESATEEAAYDSGGGIYANEVMTAEEYEAADTAGAEEGTGSSEVPEAAVSDRKLIKNVNLSVETEQFDSLVPTLEQRVTALGGYIEEMSSYSRGNEYSPDYRGTKYYRYASMTVRIPRQNLDTFLEEVGEQSNVVSRSESVTDVTLQYVDLESHKKALLTEQDRLLELMEQAESVEDIITIEGRLSEVRYQIESMEAQLRTYDNKIDYSTVYLNIDEVEHYSPSEDASVGERIRDGFMESVEGVGRGFRNFGIWFVINSPYLAVWAIAVVIVVLIIRAIIKKVAKRNAGRRVRRVDPYLQPPGRQPGPEGPMDIQAKNQNEDRGTGQKETDGK